MNPACRSIGILLIAAANMLFNHAFAQFVLQREAQHLRNTGSREWNTFPEKAIRDLRLGFAIEGGVSDYTLELTQEDVKLDWHVEVNDVEIGKLTQDEKRMTGYFRIPAAILKDSLNVMSIRSPDKIADDIIVSAITLHRGSMDNMMTAAIDISVTDTAQVTIPSRITVINDKHSLQTVTVDDHANAALRPGCVYTARKITLHVPPGSYTLYATRGVEYGVDSATVKVQAGDHISHQLILKREVDTEGWVACDTHVHTYTYSKHGDATLRERILTLAGEGIELPVSTDHNVYVDLKPTLDSVSADNPNVTMTPVIGDEVTTAVGHFNVLNIPPQKQIIDSRGKSWADVGKAIAGQGVGTNVTGSVVILNHARDIHNDFRPFDPKRHLACTGLDRYNWKLPANAMEVINSGSQQSDFTQLFEDWFGMLNGGNRMVPIGSSDSHDVNRFIVGQGRTYIKVEDAQPDQIDIGEAMRALSAGRVMVSCGLLARIVVNHSFGPGELAKGTRQVNVQVDLLGPSWSHAETVSLYMNGAKIREARVLPTPHAPIQQAFSWDIEVPMHDVYFAAVADGRMGDIPFWPIAKPYQPSSPDWTPRLFAVTGAVWVDANGNNRQESAADYASRLIRQNSGNLNDLFTKLIQYDEAVAEQVAAMLWRNGQNLDSEKVQSLISRSEPHVKRGFGRVIEGVRAWKK